MEIGQSVHTVFFKDSFSRSYLAEKVLGPDGIEVNVTTKRKREEGILVGRGGQEN